MADDEPHDSRDEIGGGRQLKSLFTAKAQIR
jgi:hypothetical protein